MRNDTLEYNNHTEYVLDIAEKILASRVRLDLAFAEFRANELHQREELHHFNLTGRSRGQ